MIESWVLTSEIHVGHQVLLLLLPSVSSYSLEPCSELSPETSQGQTAIVFSLQSREARRLERNSGTTKTRIHVLHMVSTA